MPKSTTPKWALLGTFKRYSLHVLKADAERALDEWKERQEAAGMTVKGAKSRGSYTAYDAEGAAKASAGTLKLADHPVCYIGVIQRDVQRLRAMEEAENPDFERYAARAKELSAEWSQVEAV